MNSENTVLKPYKPIDCGIKRYLIAKKYRLGEPFMIKDGESYYDENLIKRKKITFQS